MLRFSGNYKQLLDVRKKAPGSCVENIINAFLKISVTSKRTIPHNFKLPYKNIFSLRELEQQGRVDRTYTSSPSSFDAHQKTGQFSLDKLWKKRAFAKQNKVFLYGGIIKCYLKITKVDHYMYQVPLSIPFTHPVQSGELDDLRKVPHWCLSAVWSVFWCLLL